MNRSYLCINTEKVEHLWIIKDFTDCLKFVNEKCGYSVDSTKFNVNGTKKCGFHLQMSFKLEYIVCTLEWSQNSLKGMVVGQLSILDRNNEKFKSIEIQINSKGVNDEELPKLKIAKNDLFFKVLDLFPDHNLKVLCDLRILDHYDNINLIQIPKYNQSIKNDFKELLDSQNRSDVIFEVDGKEFKVHKVILMARSPVLSAMFNNDMTEKNSNRVKIEDISWSIFQLLIEFIYTDEITKQVDVKIGIDLLKAAIKYQLKSLEALCEEKLCNLLTVNNVMDILMVAELHNCTDLVKSIKSFVEIYQREIRSIVKPEHFSKYPQHIPLLLTEENE